jgi:hypothetical protein
VALLRDQRAVVMVIGALAVLNRETGLLVPLMLLIAGGRAVRENLFSWQFALGLVVSSLIVVWLGFVGRSAGVDTGAILLRNLEPERLVYVVGGLCLLPVLAIGMLGSAPPMLRKLFWMLGPLGVIVALSTDKLENGPLLLAPTALLFIPIAVLGAQAALGEQRRAPQSAQ